MSRLAHQHLGQGIHRIDTGLYRPDHTACYLIEDRGELAFVDTGATRNTQGLVELTRELGTGPEAVRWVIPTHVHLDHASGAGALMQICPDARLVVHPKGAAHLIDPSRLQASAMSVYGETAFLEAFGALEPVPESRVVSARDGQTFALGDRELTFVHTPGHANHHGCIFDSLSHGFFTGDTFGLSYREFDGDQGPWVLATTTPVAFDPDPWQNSLDRLMAMDPACIYLTHFGRLDTPGRLIEELRASIRAHTEIALAEEASADTQGRAERLQRAVYDLLVSEGARRAPHLGTEHVRELLRLDIDLNAQGLHVWLKRRAKARAAP